MSSAPSLPASQATADGIRDTIDSIVVAFILAFVFRAFIIEAFIIPTGSMGPTLYGLHGQLRCSNCGHAYVYNLQPRDEVVYTSFSSTCPNCSTENEIRAGNGYPPRIGDSGDRILVLKWPYDLGGPLGPKRWDVVVFRTPIKPTGPGEPDGKTNYIKRLIGLPGAAGEVLNIVDGDVYAAPADAVPAPVLTKLDPAHLQALSAEDLAALDRVLKIQRKTATAQASLWMLHYDHDFPARDKNAYTPAWIPETPASGWVATEPRITFDGARQDQFIALAGKAVSDSYGYNSVTGLPNYEPQDLMPVGDVRLEFVLTPAENPAGHLVLSLAKDGSTFLAQLDADGKAQLSVMRPERPQYAESLGTAQTAPLKPGRPVSIAIQNLDYRVSFDIDGQHVLETSDSQYSPDVGRARNLERQAGMHRAARTAVRIGAAGLKLELSHVKVLRDVYYRPTTRGYPPGMGPSTLDLSRAWGTGNSPIHLRPGEFFCCGDNSPQSMDSRLWQQNQLNGLLAPKSRAEYQVGTVPEDQMVGQAFFVYWPSGRRLLDGAGPPVVPNVGRMRMIR